MSSTLHSCQQHLTMLIRSWNVMLCRSRERLCRVWTQRALMGDFQ